MTRLSPPVVARSTQTMAQKPNVSIVIRKWRMWYTCWPVMRTA